jgi:hypothetical protein
MAGPFLLLKADTLFETVSNKIYYHVKKHTKHKTTLESKKNGALKREYTIFYKREVILSYRRSR